jgi:hypothetical protein
LLLLSLEQCLLLTTTSQDSAHRHVDRQIDGAPSLKVLNLGAFQLFDGGLLALSSPSVASQTKQAAAKRDGSGSGSGMGRPELPQQELSVLCWTARTRQIFPVFGYPLDQVKCTRDRRGALA